MPRESSRPRSASWMRSRSASATRPCLTPSLPIANRFRTPRARSWSCSLESISPNELALELLNQCLRGNDFSRDLLETLLRLAMSADAGLARKASHALFSIVVERLGDLFAPCLCDCYAALFSEVIAYALPEFEPAPLIERFRRVRLHKTFD